MVGKTSLAKRLTSNGFSSIYSPTMFDNYATTTTVDGKTFVLGLFDTAGQEEFDRLRTLAYVNCDVFLVCFSVTRPESLKNAADSWLREVRAHAPHVPCVLVGTHIDQRDDVGSSKKSLDHLGVYVQRKPSMAGSGHCSYVTTKEGVSAAGKLGADTYVECSALTEAGILRLKEAAIDAALNGEVRSDSGCKCACAIM